MVEICLHANQSLPHFPLGNQFCMFAAYHCSYYKHNSTQRSIYKHQNGHGPIPIMRSKIQPRREIIGPKYIRNVVVKWFHN